MTLTLLQDTLRQMVVENQSSEHRQVEQWLHESQKEQEALI